MLIIGDNLTVRLCLSIFKDKTELIAWELGTVTSIVIFVVCYWAKVAGN